nr:PREDICTED: uncharacterized protein LOC105673055 [Linepithema humile]
MFASCSVKRAVSYRLDTMSWKQESDRQLWIAKCFKKKDCHGFRVQCRTESCREFVKYAKYIKFSEHINETHPRVFNNETKNIDRKDWKFYRLTERYNTQCILCKTVLIESTNENYLLEHLSLEEVYRDDRKRTFYENQFFIWKYLDQVNDFSAKCSLCKTHIKTCFDIEEMKKHVVNKHNEKWLLLMQTGGWINKSQDNEQSLMNIINQHDWIMRYFTKSMHFEAICNFCKIRQQAIRIEEIHYHVKQHETIYNMDKFLTETLSNMDNWRCFRYTKNEKTTQCIICNLVMPLYQPIQFNLAAEDMNTHAQMHCFENFHQHNHFYHYITTQHFTLKYVNENEHYDATCTICNENIPFMYNFIELEQHIQEHNEDCKRIQKELAQETAYDQDGPSTSQTN